MPFGGAIVGHMNESHIVYPFSHRGFALLVDAGGTPRSESAGGDVPSSQINTTAPIVLQPAEQLRSTYQIFIPPSHCPLHPTQSDITIKSSRISPKLPPIR